MSVFFIYFLKVNIALALFYLLFRLVFYKDTFWTSRRIYLLSSIFISVLYPFISLAAWFEGRESVQAFVLEWAQLQEVVITPQVSSGSSLSFTGLIRALYVAVIAFFFVRFVVQLISVLRWRRKSKPSELYGIPVRILKEDTAPFSFFRSIYINPALYTDEEELKEVLVHENTHVKQYHSLDVMLGEFLTMFCWMNPAAWLLKREMRQNLEFLADNHVVKSGYDTKGYQYNLLKIALHSPDTHIVNKFNVLPLKKRIIMMNLQKTKKSGLIKYSLILPLVLLLIFSSNAETLLSSVHNMDEAQSVETETVTALQDEPEEQVFMVVEKMPSFPGGQEALFKYISESLKYPAEAQQKEIQGRVICQFVVNADGTVSDVKVMRSVNPLLDNEAVRVIENMPKWTPGEQRGKKVRTQYTIPINFSLGTDSKKSGKAVAAQNIAEKEIFSIVDKMPEFPGGQQAMFEYLNKNLKYPAEAQKNGEQGRVIVQFVVEKSGKIKDITVIRGVSSSLDKEAVRVVENMPDWTPGEQRGQKVDVKYTLPFSYKLPEEEAANEIVIMGSGGANIDK
ncbi:TonB family protein [Paludibacter sp. 221]|uniref:TonB family protein n=1 Tax=Paludibacter sp. 221 TaxID=2302939 RepID=UPI0013D6EF1E|nr:TonB family protein [Paludibacter sp. 221]NDV46147.1 TonB family protein [Paludibacter sp. 221]